MKVILCNNCQDVIENQPKVIAPATEWSYKLLGRFNICDKYVEVISRDVDFDLCQQCLVDGIDSQKGMGDK